MVRHAEQLGREGRRAFSRNSCSAAYVATMDFMKKLRDNKLMNVDFAATSKTDQKDLFTSGKAGIYIGSMPDVNSIEKDLVKNVPTAVVE